MKRRVRVGIVSGLIAASAGLSACESVVHVAEAAAPVVAAIGADMLSTAAANYSGDYAVQVQALVGSFTQTSQAALLAYVQQRQQQRLMAAGMADTGMPPAPPGMESMQGLSVPSLPPPDAGMDDDAWNEEDTAQDAQDALEGDPDFDLAQAEAGEALETAQQTEDGGGTPEQVLAAEPPITLDVALLRKSGPTAEDVAPIQDGDALSPGDGAGGGDRFRVYFRPSVDAYVYVVAIDATGWVQPVYPDLSGDVARVSSAGATLLPDPSHWFALDQYTGVYHLYFLAAEERRSDVEDELRALASQTRSVPAQPRSVTAPAVVERGFIEERGTTVLERGIVSEVRTRSGSDYEVSPDRYGFGVDGADFVLTRWFEVR